MSTYTPLITPGSADAFLTVTEAARLVRVDKSTIRRWIARGKLPAYRVGERGVRVRLSDVEQLLTPLGTGGEKGEHMRSAEQLGIAPLSEEDQQEALAASEAARSFRQQLHDQYGAMVPESWELLAASRDERGTDLLHAAKE